MIRARHEVIDRHLSELLRTYCVQDLRVGGQRTTVPQDMNRVIRTLLPKAEVRNLYLANWLLIPAGS